MERNFVNLLLIFHAIVIVLYAECTGYDNEIKAMDYAMYQDIHVMIFFGFGLLMTFLVKNGFTATGHSYLVAAFAGTLAILCLGFFERLLKRDGAEWDSIKVSVGSLIQADFAAAAVLITFCALLGRCSAVQLLVTAVIEVVLYSLNVALCEQRWFAADVGGTMLIHMFGCYFGLSTSYFFEKNAGYATRDAISTKDNHSNSVTDVFAMIGAIFLWCFWPSFVGALGDPELTQSRAVTNTYFSIASSCIVSFYVCAIVYGGKFRMVEIQNSTLAGGVAIGATADMLVGPFGALIIGGAAGIVSVVGYKHISPMLEKKYGVKDTCGINNLHGMPSLLGAVIAILMAAAATPAKYGASLIAVFPERGSRTSTGQAGFQLLCMLVTLALSIGGGALNGNIIARLPSLATFYNDEEEWLEEAATEAEERHLQGPPQVTVPPSDIASGAASVAHEEARNHADTEKLAA